MPPWWNWLVHSSAGLATRLAIGLTIFAILALADYRRNGRDATRWREYTFLLAFVAITCLYGVFNDQLTSAISWEYFYYGKGLDAVLGDHLPPDPLRLHYEAAKVGLKATWTAGLLIGVALLLANNPRKSLPRLPHAKLFSLLPLILLATLLISAISGALGYAGLFTHFSEDFRQMLARDEFRPRRFMLVYGIHLGAYAGGLLGTVLAVVRVTSLRRKLASTLPHPPAPPPRDPATPSDPP